MKLTTLILLVSLVINGFSSNALAYLKATFVGTPQPGTCNNTVVCEVYNYTGHNNIQLTQEMIPIQEVQHLDTIFNLCFKKSFMDDHSFDLVRSNGYLSTVSGSGEAL